MSRVSLIEQLYAPKKKSALEFNYDALWAPPIRFFLSQQDINELYRIATSLKYNDNIEKKYELIDAVMKPRGFKRGNCGTNRVVYNFLEDTSFCMKIALDRVGINDSPREYKNQEFFKPFCCKIFEVDPTGVIACVERVNPISSLEEFMSIADDVFNMMVTKIIGKYVVDDLGTEKYLNYGLRYNSNGTAFGPVILDYPYAYELDGAKLRCAKPIQIGNKEFACGGEIDYDAGLNNLVCCKCGRHYSARELAKDDSNVLKFYSDDDGYCRMRSRIVRADGTIVKDSGRSSKIYMTKEEYEEGTRLFEVNNLEPRRVEKTYKNKYTPIKEVRQQFYSELQLRAYEEMKKREEEAFNPAIKLESEFKYETLVKKVIKNTEEDQVEVVATVSDPNYEYPRVRPAKRAEDLDRNNEDIVNERKIEIEETKSESDDKKVIHVIEEAKITGIALMPDGSMEPELTDVKFESDDNYDLNHDIAETIREIINEDIHYPYSENGEDDELFYPQYVDKEDNKNDEETVGNMEEIEADVFPEMCNQVINIGTNISEDKDYSNYEPPEEKDNSYNDHTEDDEDKYLKEYFKSNRKEKKRKKKQRDMLSNRADFSDMSDY